MYRKLTQIKMRGNSSFWSPKKPYQIKLANSSTLLGMSKAKTWILLANAFDEAAIRNKFVYALAKDVGLAYTIDGT